MTDHLPECYVTDHPTPPACICDRLRACEQRVADDLTRQSDDYMTGLAVGKHDGWLVGYAAGVQAARDAVAALPKYPVNYLDDYSAAEALDAIDALRGES